MLDLREIAPDRPRPMRRSEYETLVAAGAYEGERVELLEGVIVEMSPHGAPHDSTVDRLTELLVLALHGRARIRVQGAFAASELSEPEPDLAVLPPGDYDDAHPESAWLIVEVSKSSLAKDRGLKARLYARSGVEEYWVVNLVDRVIEVHSNPSEQGYARCAVVSSGESIRLLHFPDVSVAVDSVLR